MPHANNGRERGATLFRTLIGKSGNLDMDGDVCICAVGWGGARPFGAQLPSLKDFKQRRDDSGHLNPNPFR